MFIVGRKSGVRWIRTQLMRSDMFDEELLSLMDRCGNTLKPSKERRKREAKEARGWTILEVSLMERCGNTLKPSKGTKKARGQGGLS
jgi:hypothetical protein